MSLKLATSKQVGKFVMGFFDINGRTVTYISDTWLGGVIPPKNLSPTHYEEENRASDS